VIILSLDETEDKGSIEEDTWSFGSETSNSSDPDFKTRKGRGRSK